MSTEKTASSSASNKQRACLNCSIIKPSAYFKEYGCPNCPFMQINKGKNLNLTTSFSFKGSISLLNPKKSWVAKWQRINNCVPGTYAMTVEGGLDDVFIEKVEKEGRVYFNRAKSFELG